MMTINDLTIEDLLRVMEDPSLTEEQSRKVKIHTISRLQELEKSGKLTDEQKRVTTRKIKEIKADVFGVEDMGYPYIPHDKVQAKRSINTQQHVDMYCGSEPLVQN